MGPAAKSAEEKKPRRKLCFASLGIGVTLAGIALAAMTIDLANNFEFGSKITHELGLVMALAAVALTALPAAAALLGRWDMLLRVGTIFAVLLTVLAAVSAYSEKQGAQLLERKAGNATYEQALADAADARREIAAARAEAAAIAETSTPEQLRLLVAEAKDKAGREADRKGCGTKCEAAKDAVTALIARLGQAETKVAALDRAVEAQARLDAAKGDTKAGPKEASMLATVIAGQTGHNAEDVARAIALGTTGFSIAVTLVMALLMHSATALLMKGLGLIHGEKDAEAVQDAATAAKLAEPAQKPRQTRKPLTEAERLDRFIEDKVKTGIAGKFLTPAQLYELFAVWWVSHAPTVPVPSQRALGLRLSQRGMGSIKRGGARVYEGMMVN